MPEQLLNPLDEQRRHCVVAVYDDLVRRGQARAGDDALGRAFAICTASLQRGGYLRPNSERPTKKGIVRSVELWFDPSSRTVRERFEQIVARARQDRRGSPNAVKLPAESRQIKAYLRPLRSAMNKVFNCDTAYGDCLPDRPSGGHCMLAAMAVQDLFGGTVVQGTVKNIPHYWNRIGDFEVDLTGDQFGKGFAPIRVKKGALHESHPFFRAPYESLTQPYNHVACTMHDRFIRRLSKQLREDGHPVWANVLSRGGCRK